MSEQENSNSAAPDNAAPVQTATEKPTKAANKSKNAKGKWMRRLRVLVLLVLFLAVLSRVIIVVLLPPVLRHVAGYYGLEASYERLELSVLSGDTGLWHLVIKPKDSSEPLAVIDYCRGDISVLNLLRGRLHVWRVEADGVNLSVDRLPDGSVPLLKLVAQNAQAKSQPAPSPSSGTVAPRKVDLTPPLRLDALRLTHLHAHVRDKAVSPPLDTVVSIDLRLSELGGTSGRPTVFSADVDADPFLDALHVTGEGRTQNGSVDATFGANVNGLRLRPLAPYLAAFGLRPMANETTLRASGALKIGPAEGNDNIATASLQLDNVSLLADGEEAAALDHLMLEAPALDPHRLGLKQLKLDNVRLSGRRSADGRLRFAGLEYIGMPASQSTPWGPIMLPIIDLPLVDVKNFSATFHDDAVEPAADLSLVVDDLSVKQILLDPAHPDASIAIVGLAHLPGVAGNVHLSGSVQPMAAKKSLTLSMSADQVALNAIQPYLDQLGVTSSIEGAQFSADLSAQFQKQPDGATVAGELKNIKLAQGGDLVAMDHLRLGGAQLGKGMTVNEISIAGPRLAIVHEADGTIAAAGLRFDPKRFQEKHKSEGNAVASNAAPTTTTVAPTLPAIVVKHFRWDGVDVTYDDRAMSPPLHTQIADAGADYDNGKVRAWLKAPGIVEQLALDGQIDATPTGAKGQVKFDTTGVDSTIATPLLQVFHIEPTLRHGAISAKADFAVASQDQSMGGSINLADVSYREGEHELAGADRVAIDSVKLTGRTLAVGAVQVDRPRASVTREANGAWAGAGVRVLPAAFASKDDRASASPVPTSGGPASSSSGASPFVISLDALHLKDGSLRFVDQVKSTDTTATASLDVGHAAIGRPAEPTTIALRAAVSGVIDQATVDGSVSLDPSSPSADLTIHATNVRAGALAAYLPPDIKVPLKDGTFQTKLQAAIAPAKAGGSSAKLILTDLDFREAGANQPLMKLASARAIASRIDPAKNVLSVDELSTDGVELSAARTASGGIRALGVELSGQNAAPIATPRTAPSTTPAFASTLPTTKPAASVQSLVAAAQKTLPTLQLDRLAANVQRLTITDEQRPSAAPLVINDVHLRNLSPVDWGGADPDSRQPGRFQVDCAVDQTVGALTVAITTSPLASQPTLALDVLARQIRGDGLTNLVTELKPDLHGESLTDGEFHLHGETTLRLSRRGLTQIDYSAPIDADLDLKPITFRGEKDGPILLGLHELRSESIHFEPKNGALHVKSIEITKPVGRLWREKDGVHVAGVVFQPPAPATQPSTQPAVASAQDSISKLAAAPVQRGAKPQAEIRLDQLVITDLDFVAEDKTVDPPLVVPLNRMDVEVRDFSNFAPYEDRQLKFSAMVNAGKVRLPKPLKSSGLAGAMSDAGQLLGGKKVETAREYEDRELFAEASANGSIGLYPKPKGYIKASLGGLEMQELSSFASQYGITLSKGVFDGTIDARLPGDGTIQTKSKFVMTDLGVTEPPNGPIFRYLHLPAPLDAVIGALQDQEGSITVPLDVPVKSDMLSAQALAGPAIGAFGSIVATALASTPLKAAGAVSDILGIPKKETKPEPPIAFAFDAGDVTLSADELAALARLRQRMIKEPALVLVIRHLLGGGDASIAQMRANPSPQDAQLLAQRLREQQTQAARLRFELAGIAQSDLQRGVPSDVALARLRAINQQMAQTDQAMDELFDLLRPGADRLSDRRTRAVCLQYGKQRLAAIKSTLLEGAPAEMADRVHLLTPQYAASDEQEGGKVVIQLIPKKK